MTLSDPRPNEQFHLMRTQYRTDVGEDDPAYWGALSSTIPGSALLQGRIVDVDWSERGWVTVTYLLHGPGHE